MIVDSILVLFWIGPREEIDGEILTEDFTVFIALRSSVFRLNAAIALRNEKNTLKRAVSDKYGLQPNCVVVIFSHLTVNAVYRGVAQSG